MKIILYLSLTLIQFLSKVINITVSDYPAQSVKIGWYPEMEVWNVSLPNCGLRYKPERFKVVFNRKCFHNKYKSRDVVDYEGIRYGSRGGGGIDNELMYNRVFLGLIAAYYEAPYVVSVKKSYWFGLKTGSCTGVLVSPQWVLTAAHCWNDPGTDTDTSSYSTTVYAGGNYWSGIEERAVVKAIIHPGYIYNGIEDNNHDIAMYKLKHSFTRERTDGRHFAINSICLPEAERANQTTDYERAIFYGYGDKGDGSPSTILQRGELNLRWCQTGTQLCSRASVNSNDSRTCIGDSGGPLIQFADKYKTRAFLRGINWGHISDCSRTNTKSVFVDVSDHIKWIFDTIKNH